MRRIFVVLVIGQVSSISNTLEAQKDSVAHPTAESRWHAAWLAPVGIAASAVLDPEVREWSLRERSRSLDHLAKAVNPLGTAQVLVPVMALTYAGALVTHHGSFASGTLNTAAAYVASDLVESALKPMLGRERPHVEGNSHHFHPFTANGDWHSLPSAHVAHIASIAVAISMQSHSSPITAVCSAIVGLVGWDRVYEDQHWASDVAATIALTTMVTSATVRWLESRRASH